MAALESGITIGHYRILEPLGAGGMATVYKAVHTTLDRIVAVKILEAVHQADAEFLARFRQEARTVARLHHPHIMEIYDFDEQDGNTYLVMEYVEGGALTSHVSAPMLIDSVARILAEVASALDYAHRQGVLHRDVKPSNILLRANQAAVIGDFGLAKILEGDSGLTRIGTVVGTPEYMSPEQAMGQPLDARSDIYSLGATLYHLLVGRVPYSGSSPLATIVAQVHDPLPSPRSINPSIPEEVAEVVTRALAKNPTDRYHSAGELADAFVDALRRSGGPVPVSGSFNGDLLADAENHRTRSMAALPASGVVPQAGAGAAAPIATKGTSRRPGVKLALAAVVGALVLLAIPAGELWHRASDTAMTVAAPPVGIITPTGAAGLPSPTIAVPVVIPTTTLPVVSTVVEATPTAEPQLTVTAEPTDEPTSPPPTEVPPTQRPTAARPLPTRVPPTRVPIELPAPTDPPRPAPTAVRPVILPMGEDSGALPQPVFLTPLRRATPPPGVEIGPMGATTPMVLPTGRDPDTSPRLRLTPLRLATAPPGVEIGPMGTP